MADTTLRSGIFLAPFHPTEEDPTLAIRRDLELVEWLDRLGYEEAWVGEHHSAGFEIISSPEVFIAAAAERGADPAPAVARLVGELSRAVHEAREEMAA